MKVETKKDTRYANQRVRQQNYPKNRICFLSTETAAKNDLTIFGKYYDGKITKWDAMRAIAKNNCLEEVTEEQFINELILTGWYVPYRGRGNDS